MVDGFWVPMVLLEALTTRNNWQCTRRTKKTLDEVLWKAKYWSTCLGAAIPRSFLRTQPSMAFTSSIHLSIDLPYTDIWASVSPSV